MPPWTFITKHAATLSLIAQNPRITALELSLTIGVTERAVRKIIAELYAAGYIKKKRVGRGVRYRINRDLPLRRDTHRMVAIGDFLESLGWNRHRKRMKNGNRQQVEQDTG
jgi:DNA-binding transcriptional ArsR family regulator